jgi:hypothetical protein
MHKPRSARCSTRDPELGFCILAHQYKGAKESPPHDHGPSWAIYGQAKGETEMTDYRAGRAGERGQAGQGEALRTYKLTPGTAYLYNEGDLHSPRAHRPDAAHPPRRHEHGSDQAASLRSGLTKIRDRPRLICPPQSPNFRELEYRQGLSPP